jgi:hypothetical protein
LSWLNYVLDRFAMRWLPEDDSRSRDSESHLAGGFPDFAYRVKATYPSGEFRTYHYFDDDALVRGVAGIKGKLRECAITIEIMTGSWKRDGVWELTLS